MQDVSNLSRERLLEPNNYSFVIEGELAGMSKPSSLPENLNFLLGDNVGLIVSLTESYRTPCSDIIRSTGIEHLHLPVQDFTPPRLQQIKTFVNCSKEMIAQGKAVCVHCLGGMGRTGTMLACYLVSTGYSAEDAIGQVRMKRPGSIETKEQEEVVAQWEKVWKQDQQKQKEDSK